MGYPSTTFAPTTKNAGDTIQPAHVNDLQTEVVAVETTLISALTTARGVIVAGTSATGAWQNIGAGTSGQVLTSQGASANPNWAAAAAIPNPVVQDLLFTDATYDIGKSGATRPRDLFISRNEVIGAKLTSYNGVTTAGFGQPIIVASGRATGQTAAVASVATFTPGADGTFQIAVNVLVTTATTHNFVIQVSYKDEGGTARTSSIPLFALGVGAVTGVANGSGAIPYQGYAITIRAKAANAITILTEAAGTYTSVVFNVDGTILQIA